MLSTILAACGGGSTTTAATGAAGPRNATGAALRACLEGAGATQQQAPTGEDESGVMRIGSSTFSVGSSKTTINGVTTLSWTSAVWFGAEPTAAQRAAVDACLA